MHTTTTPHAQNPDLPRSIGFWSACGVVVGVIVGSGIYRTPVEIAGQMSSPALILALWAAGGLVALLGALTFAELATLMPRSGGVYVFLRAAWGPSTAFVFGWTYMLLVKPFAAAGIAVVFAENLNTVLGTRWNTALVVCVMLVALTTLNHLGTRMAAGVALTLTTIKIASLLLIVALALFGPGSAVHLRDQPATAQPAFWAALMPVMAAIMWTYDGWADAGAIAGEVRDPQRTLPRVLLTGTLAVTGLYLLVNAAYFYTLPMDAMRAEAGEGRSNSVAGAVAAALVGPRGMMIMAGVAALSALGSTQSSILVGARVTFAQARDRLMFSPLSAVSTRFHTPGVALWVQCGLSCAAIVWFREFGTLAENFVFTMWIFYGLAGLSLFVLRVRRPNAPRPFRCPGYPVVPALFVGSAAFMTVMAICGKPGATLPWVGVLIAGYPVYFAWRALGGGASYGDQP